VIVGVLSTVVDPGIGEIIVVNTVTSVSTVNIMVFTTVLPAASRAVATRVCVPLVNGVVGTIVHAPVLLTVVVPITVDPDIIVITLFGSPVPDSGISGLFVIDPATGASTTKSGRSVSI
jgi:hypothetical protein